jgi:hypothetical protein
MRIAQVYGGVIDDLLIYNLGFTAISSENLDINPPEQLLWKLSECTGVSFDRIRALTVRGWVPLLIDEIDPESNDFPTYVGGHSLLYPVSLRPLYQINNWVPWLRITPSQPIQGCRICMQEKPEPYRRLSWRMNWMMSCPKHGVMLEDTYWVTDENMNPIIGSPEPAPPEIIELDLLTAQAVEKGVVSLPRRKVHGGLWLRLLRALLDELCQPAFLLKRYRTNIVRIWERLGLEVRQGLRSIKVPFEMMQIEHQRLLMTAAGVAVQMIKNQDFKKKGHDVLLFQPLPISQKDLLSVPAEEENMQPEASGGIIDRNAFRT